VKEAIPMSDHKAGSPSEDLPLFLSHDEMTLACEQGTASLLSGEINGIARHLETWWVEYERGWLRIADKQVLSDLDCAADRLAAARLSAKGAPECSPPRL
jgi:hypothetical protein